MTSRLEGGRAGLAILTVVGLVLSMFALFANSPAQADHVDPDDIVPQSSAANQAPYWEDYLATKRGIDDASCSKIDQAGDEPFVMPPAGDDPWVLLVVKQATTNYVYYDPTGDHPYPSTGDQAPGYSHLIVCSAPEDPPPTEPPPTEPPPTEPPPTEPPPTEPPPTEPPPTEPPPTEPPPTEPPTTEPPTTAPPTTSDEVLGTSITAAPSTTVAVSVTSDTLPFTGFENGTTGLFAMLLVGIGLVALAGARKFGEEDS